MLHVVQGALRGERPRDVVRRSTIIGIVSFLTLIDLFGSQALLPRLVDAFGTDTGTMGVAVNASTFGMAASGLTVAWFADRIDRKRGIWISLALLSVPTFLLGFVDSVWAFMALRVAQGVFMAAAFTLTMTYLSEQCDITAASGAMAAYITGNVASNLFGRLLAVSSADIAGLTGSFAFFAVLNLIGAAVALILIGPKDEQKPMRGGPPLQAWREHIGRAELRAAFALGFVILFVFVGVFTYVNLHLVENLGVAPAALGLVYLVFAPALFTTPLASGAVRRWGPRPVFWASMAAALGGLAMTLSPSLIPVLIGLAIIGSGTFFAQAAATGFVGRAAKTNRAAANGLYLTCYYIGGLVGAFVLGQANNVWAWGGVAGIVAGLLILAAVVARNLKETSPTAS
ncbi:MAG: MFS transporter [Pseudomonadota bacterium]